MNNTDIMELICIVRSCSNNYKKFINNAEIVKACDKRCFDFCSKHNIKITHGSAFKELRHKSYYYINKNIKSIALKGNDLYQLYENKIISSNEVVDYLLNHFSDSKED